MSAGDDGGSEIWHAVGSRPRTWKRPCRRGQQPATLTPTPAALFGSIVTALAIFGGGLAVEAYKRRRDRMALAGAVDALLGLIEMWQMTEELWEALSDLDAGLHVEFVALIDENAPFRAITLSYAGQLGNLGGDLPFRVARFLTFSQGLTHDLVALALIALARNKDNPATQAKLIRTMRPLWEGTRTLGVMLVADPRRAAGIRRVGQGATAGVPGG